MSPDIVCPVCNGIISPEDHECQRCGFRLAGCTETFAPLDMSDPSIPPVSTGDRSCQFSLYVSKGPQAHEEFYLDEPIISMGRDPHCDIFLNDMTVSRQHATITVEGNKVTVRDESSLNGTWVNGSIVEEAELVQGSIIQVGTFTMVLQEHAAL
jgi:hypothetical protein